LMYMTEAKDRLVVRALERHNDELDQYFDDDDDDEDMADNALADEAVYLAPGQARQRR
jgi:hypothetical protein